MRWNVLRRQPPAGWQRLFVYGSLKRGLGLHRLIEGSETIDRGTQRLAGFTLIDLGAFPGAVRAGPDQHVVGEVYDVPASCYDRIRDMEVAAGYVQSSGRTMEGDRVTYFEWLTYRRSLVVGPEWTRGHQEAGLARLQGRV